MLTVLEAIRLSTDYLAKKGIQESRTNAELLLAEILGCKRLDLYLKFDRPLNETEKDTYRDYIARRGKFEPLQYIVKNVEFYGLEFEVDSSVLIPRQETEILVENIIEHHKDKSGLNILDIGSGSGIIAITLAKYLPASKVTAIDVSPEAIEVAAKNSISSGTGTQIEFRKMDVLTDEVLNLSGFDIVVSNPPYISKSDFENSQKELFFEPSIALTDNSDGYTFYRRISEVGKFILKEEGMLYFEAGEGQSGPIEKIMTENNYSRIEVFQDYLKINRVVKGVK